MFEIFIYILIFLILFLLELFYFNIAEKYKVIDHPNERSSHQILTIRGGGIIFPIAIILTLFFVKNALVLLIPAVLLIGMVSFWDDVKNVPNYIRFLIHTLAVTMLLENMNAFRLWPLWIIILTFILIIGVINAFNFMDGINGITGIYSLVMLASLLFVNQKFNFINKFFIIIPLIACLVFLVFNFRKKAKCFAGDVGSVSIGFWTATLLLIVIATTGDFKYILFLSVYGVDTVLTILHRLILKQNIFKAHRMHLFQYLVNEREFPHLTVATIYGVLQIGINLFVLKTNYNFIVTFLIVIVPVGLGYWFFKFVAKPTYK